jgi:hypothetical protein
MSKIGRRYNLNMPPTTVSAAQDLFQFNGVAGLMYRIIRQWISCTDTTIATGQMISLRSRRLPATVTSGSGGTGSLTPANLDPGDATCSSTGNLINSTTKATTSGTAVITWLGSTHLYAAHLWDYEQADQHIFVPPSTAWVFELLSTVSGTVNLSGGIEIEELG